MLHEFLTANRAQLVDRCRLRVAARRAPRATPAELEHGIPLFLDQLTAMLPTGVPSGQSAQASASRASAAESRIKEGAASHGSELLRHDFTIDQVVHDYGDLCQSITEVANEQQAPITVEEFGTLNIRLDNAIADAVTEYTRQRDVSWAHEGTVATNERLGALAGEMRGLLNTVIVAISAIKGGGVGFGGATAAALDRSLLGLRGLIDRTLAEVRLESDAPASLETIELAPFIAEVRVAAALEASTTGCELTVTPVEPGILVEADRHILASAVSNLLQNAFGCTRVEGHILLGARASQGRVLIEVEDQGAPAAGGAREDGLSLSRQSVAASGGQLHMRNLAGRGCVFTIELPQKLPPSAAGREVPPGAGRGKDQSFGAFP